MIKIKTLVMVTMFSILFFSCSSITPKQDGTALNNISVEFKIEDINRGGEHFTKNGGGYRITDPTMELFYVDLEVINTSQSPIAVNLYGSIVKPGKFFMNKQIDSSAVSVRVYTAFRNAFKKDGILDLEPKESAKRRIYFIVSKEITPKKLILTKNGNFEIDLSQN